MQKDKKGPVNRRNFLKGQRRVLPLLLRSLFLLSRRHHPRLQPLQPHEPKPPAKAVRPPTSWSMYSNRWALNTPSRCRRETSLGLSNPLPTTAATKIPSGSPA